MALLNNLYIFVEDESVDRSIESTSHPVEKGIDITDTIRRKPVTLNLSGMIVNTDKHTASNIKSKIVKLQKEASLITYKGKNNFTNLQIQSFSTSHTKEVWGGMTFSMELKEVRIAKSSYQAKKTKKNPDNNSQGNKQSKPNLKLNATVVFKGGNVYVSSDATKVAAKRGRSTCKITKINTKSSAKHQYHLISKDKGKVYGWVDKKNIEGTGTNETKSKTNKGTQQVSQGKKTAVYHKVKKGDTVYSLVNKKYKSLGKTTKWVINNNPNAFSKKGDATTLKVGAKLLMGYKT